LADGAGSRFFSNEWVDYARQEIQERGLQVILRLFCMILTDERG